MADSEKRLVIFDCDGVLVDSEPISVSVLVKAMNDLNVPITEEEVYGRFLGRSLATVIDTMKTEYDVHPGEAFLEQIRTDLYARFRTELKPIGALVRPSMRSIFPAASRRPARSSASACR
jgi:beta-phosphoglucomutase-like phosphatase (HAD superfamily)